MACFSGYSRYVIPPPIPFSFPRVSSAHASSVFSRTVTDRLSGRIEPCGYEMSDKTLKRRNEFPIGRIPPRIFIPQSRFPLLKPNQSGHQRPERKGCGRDKACKLRLSKIFEFPDDSRQGIGLLNIHVFSIPLFAVGCSRAPNVARF